MTWYRKLLWLPVLALVLGACAQTQQTELGEPSDDVSAYLSSVADVESTVEDSFDQVSDALAISYNTREVMFTAIRDVGYEAVVESALTQAEAINPAEGYVADHEAWLAHRLLATEKTVELTEALDAEDLQMMFAAFSVLDQDWAAVLRVSRREFCVAVSEFSALCQAPHDLPGGDYGAEVYEVLRLNTLATFGLFNFFGDMTPEERSLRLDEVQPQIESSLRAGGDAMKAIDPPDEYEVEHQALIRFFDDQYANAVAITQANSERDDATVLELFRASGVVFDVALKEMSDEYREIAAPWIGPEPTN
ncbi:MAG: hypothetical protein M3132_00610 [Actinomycetia bacterium]|nr:hypothetical protein [Actinomycetes bacterium]